MSRKSRRQRPQSSPPWVVDLSRLLRERLPQGLGQPLLAFLLGLLLGRLLLAFLGQP